MDWKFNCWTGDSTLRIDENTRIVRVGQKQPYLYRAEYWGDYSLEYPRRGPCRKSLPQARQDCRALALGPIEEAEPAGPSVWAQLGASIADVVFAPDYYEGPWSVQFTWQGKRLRRVCQSHASAEMWSRAIQRYYGEGSCCGLNLTTSKVRA